MYIISRKRPNFMKYYYKWKLARARERILESSLESNSRNEAIRFPRVE